MTPTPAVAGYSPLLAKAASNRPPEHDFVHDGLNAYEREVLEWADSRLFGNDNFLESRWGPGNWPTALGANFASDVERWADNFGINLDDPLSDEELRLASVQAVLLLMLEIDIEKQANGQHVVSWGVDGLDRVLDDLGVYPGMCVHCYGRSGYDTTEGLGQHYIVILGTGHVHREMLKTIAYLAKANGEGVLVRSFLDNDADDFDLLYKRKQEFMPSARGTGSFAYENVSFMSQIRLPDGTLQTYPTLAFSMVGNVATEREAVERVYDHIRKNVKHFTGDLDNFANLFRPHTVTPHTRGYLSAGDTLDRKNVGSPQESRTPPTFLEPAPAPGTAIEIPPLPYPHTPTSTNFPIVPRPRQNHRDKITACTNSTGKRKAMTTTGQKHPETEELIQEFSRYINAARNERFEDGMESRFSQRVRKSILNGGSNAVSTWIEALTLRANAYETTEEFLRIIGDMRDEQSHEKRTKALTEMLQHRDPAVRDSAGLGLAALEDPSVLPALNEAIATETMEWVRKGLQQVTEQLTGE